METAKVDPKLKRTIILLVMIPVCLCVVSLALSTIYFSENYPQTSVEFTREYGGSEDRYQQILTSNDCAWLEEEYDRASVIDKTYELGTTLYQRAEGIMKATSKRMQEIGCYD